MAGNSDIFMGNESRASGIGARAGSPIPSEAGDTDFGRRGAGGISALPGAGAFGGAEVRAENKPVSLIGRGNPQSDPRLFRYDTLRGNVRILPIAVTKDDRMSPTKAGDTLHKIHELMGVVAEDETILAAFDRALWFCHTLNSASTLIPGRSTFAVEGRTQEFSFDAIVRFLGTDLRRFFRAYADEIAKANKRILDNYDPYNYVAVEQHGNLLQVARDRGMQRFPYLAHDSAEAGLSLTTEEAMALARSKISVIEAVKNSADRMNPNSRAITADGYDSSIHGT